MASRAWASFLAGFAVHPTAGDNDPSVRWSLLAFRWGLTAVYVCVSLIIGLGQTPEWVIATIGYLVIYHLATTLHTTVHMRRGHPVMWFWELIPFADIVAVSLILASASSVTFPVWVAYAFIVFGASISRGNSYVLTLTGACVAGYAAAVGSHLATAQPVPWPEVIVIAIMMALGGWLATIRASFEHTLYQDLNESEERARRSEDQYRGLVEHSPDCIAVHCEGRVVYANRAGAEIFGAASPEELIGRPILDFVHPDYREVVMARVRETQEKQRQVRQLEEKFIRLDGRVIDVEVTAIPATHQGKAATQVIVKDITERKRAEQALHARERQQAVVAELGQRALASTELSTLMDDAVVLVAQALEVEYCKILELLPDGETLLLRAGVGWMEGLVGQATIGTESDSQAGYTLLSNEPIVVEDLRTESRFSGPPLLFDHQVVSGLSVVISGGGRPFGVFGIHTSERRTFSEDDIHFLQAAANVLAAAIQRKQAEEAAQHLAYHDALTGLPNRTLFEDRLTVALAQAHRKEQSVAVMFLDLDRFKIVNDTVGHTFGDQLLQNVAERLNGLLREGDTVARMGGDEFTVLLPEVTQAGDAVEIAERILETLRQPWRINNREFHVTTSIGIAIYPSDGEDAESLIRNADTAMYRAKEQGRDKFELFTAAMNASMVERLALENSLRRGLERDEFVVHYQPQVNIRSGRIVGNEALVRWQHPERGLVSPMEFIPVAEETGLIVPLGAWVLQTACAQNAAWQQAGHAPMPVAVNLSARQFQQRDLLDTVTQALEESGMDPQYLILEITEGVAMHDAESTATTLRALREMGIQIAIDDFGTGHSSLSYLKRFPVSALKIDRSFVRDLTIDPEDAAITAAIIAMAKSLKLKVIAEGVESEEQLAFLKEHGCDEMQGFLFSKPVPAPALEKMLARVSRPRALARRSG